MNPLSNTSQLRQRLRQKRRQLSAIEQQRHSLKITQRIIHSRFFKHSRNIAVYLPNDGEVDLTPLIQRLFKPFSDRKKRYYLPVIISRRDAIIRFAPFTQGSKMRKNCFAIDEPVYQRRHLKSAIHMDLILAPLVGFDAEGNRMGMGGGYYDRALQHLRSKSAKGRSIIKPRFVGVAHAVQKVAKLERQQWDIPLHAIVTEQELSYFG